MSSVNYEKMKVAMLLAGFQKAEEEIEKRRGIETTRHLIETNELEALSMWDVLYEYLPGLFELIDLESDISSNIGYFYLFQEIMEDIYNDNNGDVANLYQLHLGLLSAAVEQYGIEPFEEIIKEFERSLDSMGLYPMNLAECCNFMYIDVEGVSEEFLKKIQKYASYLRFTYVLQTDVVYVSHDEIMKMAKEVVTFAEAYDEFCEKLAKICISLKGDRVA